jgi:UDP-glucose 4-epimerase
LKQSIIITGIKGFLGSYLANLLISDYIIQGIGKTNEFFDDIQVYSSEQIQKINFNPSFVIMCHAAVASGNYSPTHDELYEVNVNLTQQIINQFSKSKIIYISSASIFDSHSDPIKESSENQPQSEYAKSKLEAEKIVFKTQNAVIFRLSSLYGIGMKENTIIPNYVNQALNNKVIEVWGDGLRKQNYIYVKDACEYVKKSLERFEKVKNKVLLAVDKNEISNIELAQTIAQATNSNIHFVNEDFSKSLHYDNHLTCHLLNWEPTTDFVAEIQKYIRWKKGQF